MVGVRLRLATHRLRVAEAAKRAASAAELGAQVEDQLCQELAAAIDKQGTLMQRYLEHQGHGNPDSVIQSLANIYINLEPHRTTMPKVLPLLGGVPVT